MSARGGRGGRGGSSGGSGRGGSGSAARAAAADARGARGGGGGGAAGLALGKKGGVASAPKIEDKKWTIDNSKILGAQFATLFNDAKTADCAFLLSPPEALTPVVVYAHRLLIGSWSDTLRNMLAGGTGAERKSEKEGKGEKKGAAADASEAKDAKEAKKSDPEIAKSLGLSPDCVVVPVTVSDPDLFTKLIQYFYTGKFELSNLNIAGVITIATDFKVEALLDCCLQYMGDSLAIDTVCRLAILAHKFSYRDLHEKYNKFVFLNAPRVMRTSGWLELPFELLLSYVQSDQFAAPEIDVFHGIERWCSATPATGTAAATAETPKEGKTETPTSTPRKDHAPALLAHVRFAQMKLKELMKEVRPTGLLADTIIWRLVELLAEATPPASDSKEFNMKRREPPATHRAATERFEDNTGLMWFLGTNEGRGDTYRNPIGTADLKANMSSTAGANPTSLADRIITTGAVENAYGRDPNPWLEYEFRRHRVRLEGFYVAQDQDHYLRNWQVQASDDGKTYVTLREFTNDQSITSGQRWAFFTVPESVAFYKRIRLFVTGPSHAGSTNFDITQLELYGWIVKDDGSA